MPFGYEDLEEPQYENHKKQFTGYWIPRELVDLFERRKITAEELILLQQIGSLVKSGPYGVGCWASDKWLADRMGLSERTIRTQLAKLRELNLLKNVCFEGRVRYMETRWSRAKFRGGLKAMRKAKREAGHTN